MSTILSLLTGGATGLIGTLLSGVLKHFNTRQDQNHELKKMDKELAIMVAEADRAEKIAAIEAEATERKAEWEGLQASYREASTRFSSGEHPALVVVDVVRGLMRPVLTMGLVLLVGIIYFTVTDSSGKIQPRIVDTILYLATAAVLWWFGSRQVEKKQK